MYKTKTFSQKLMQTSAIRINSKVQGM